MPRDLYVKLEFTPKESEDKTYLLEIRFLDKESGEGISETTVYVESFEDDSFSTEKTTDSVGRVENVEVPPKDLQISGNPEGYEPNDVLVESSEFTE